MPATAYAIDNLSGEQVARWSELLLLSPFKSAFLSHSFCKAVHAVRGGVYVVHIREQDGVEGFLPFQIRRGRSLLGHAEKVGASMSDFFGIAGNLRMEHDATEFLQAAGISALRFDHAVLALCPFSFHDAETRRGVRLQVDNYAKFTETLLGMNKAFVKSVLHREKRLRNELGAIEFSWKSVDFQALDRLIVAKREQSLRLTSWIAWRSLGHAIFSGVCFVPAGSRLRGRAVDTACWWQMDRIEVESCLRRYLA